MNNQWNVFGKSKLDLWLFICIVAGIIFFAGSDLLDYLSVTRRGVPYCFDVDSDGNIYLGVVKRIYVYKDGELLRIIAPPTSRAYKFYIEDDMLFIACASDLSVDVCDLEGKTLVYEEPPQYFEVEDKAPIKTVTKNGHVYKASNLGGLIPYRIERDGVEVFRESTLDYLFNELPFWLVETVLSIVFFFLVLMKISDVIEKSSPPYLGPMP